MKKLMMMVIAGVAIAAFGADGYTGYSVYTFQQTGKAFNAENGKTETQKVNGLAVYNAAAEQVLFCTYGTKKDTTFVSGAKVGKKAYTGTLADATFFEDMLVNGKKQAYGYKLGDNQGYAIGNEKSVKGNFVGKQVFGTWQFKLDSSATKKLATGKFDLNGLLEAKNIEIVQ